MRWKETLSDLESKTSTVIGDSLLLSSCLTYLGPFTPSLRHSLLAKWKHLCHENAVPCDTEFSLEGALSDSERVCTEGTGGEGGSYIQGWVGSTLFQSKLDAIFHGYPR